MGSVLSTLTVYEALPVLPARSLHVALRRRLPSPDDKVLAAQLVLSIPDPPGLSFQFHVTVASPMFHPAPLGRGDTTGNALGAMASGKLTIGEQDRVPLRIA